MEKAGEGECANLPCSTRSRGAAAGLADGWVAVGHTPPRQRAMLRRLEPFVLRRSGLAFNRVLLQGHLMRLAAALLALAAFGALRMACS